MALADENAVVFRAGEVLLSLDDAVVFALRFIEHHADPLAGGELRRTDEGYGAHGILARDLHAVPDSHRWRRHSGVTRDSLARSALNTRSRGLVTT